MTYYITIIIITIINCISFIAINQPDHVTTFV